MFCLLRSASPSPTSRNTTVFRRASTQLDLVRNIWPGQMTAKISTHSLWMVNIFSSMDQFLLSSIEKARPSRLWPPRKVQHWPQVNWTNWRRHRDHYRQVEIREDDTYGPFCRGWQLRHWGYRLQECMLWWNGCALQCYQLDWIELLGRP